MLGKRRAKLISRQLMTIIVVSLVLTVCWACGGGKGGSKKKPPKKKTKITAGPKLPDGAWGGFAVPLSESKKWSQWLKKYKNNQKLLDAMNNNGNATDDTDGPGSSWPYSWKGAGIGNEGFPPMETPPWGYNIKYTGLPTFCYTVPQKGYCSEWESKFKKPSARWSYNPYTEECQEFKYSGCRGNNNNFLTKLKCLQVCNAPLPKGCDDEFDSLLQQGQFIDEQVPLEFQDRKRRCGNDPNV